MILGNEIFDEYVAAKGQDGVKVEMGVFALFEYERVCENCISVKSPQHSYEWFELFFIYNEKSFGSHKYPHYTRNISLCLETIFLLCSATLQKDSLTFLLQNVLSVWKERNE